MKNFTVNPVLNKEFTLRFRSFKSFLGILFYLLALGIIIIGFVFLQTVASGQGFFRPSESREMFLLLSLLQLALVLFITPGLTAGVISSEREKQTLNILLTTTQSSTSIVFSKLVSSVSYLMLLIIASLPLYSIVFLFGGISPGQFLITVGFYIFSIIVFGSIGLLFSTLIRKTIVAMVTSYALTLFLAGGTAFITLLLIEMSYGFNTSGVTGAFPLPYFTAMINPFIVLFTIFEPYMADELAQFTGIDIPLWISFIISYTLIAAASLFISIRKLRPNMKKG